MIIQYSDNNENRIEWQHRRGGEWRTAELDELIEAYERATEPGDLISREEAFVKDKNVLGKNGGRMMLIKGIVCLFKGHDIDPDESIVKDIMHDKRNWLCQCHRCGLYEMHDGAILNQSITLTKNMAMRTKRDLERDMEELHRRIRGEEDADKITK